MNEKTMTKETPVGGLKMKTSVRGRCTWAAVLVSLAAASSAFGYSDVLTGLNAVAPNDNPRLRFSWTAVFHQDTFVASDLGGAGSPYVGGKGGYVVLGQPDYTDGLDHTDRTVSYGAGNVVKVNYWNGSGQMRTLSYDSVLKLAMGNLAIASQTLISPGDTLSTGPALAVDALTRAGTQPPGLLVPAIKFVDSNNDGIIQFETRYNFKVTPGNNLYYDYNRDGTVDNGALRSAAQGGLSDRPFIAVYEDVSAGRLPIDLDNPPNVDHDADGVSLVDNLWVGNPYSPVDADRPAVGGPRGTDGVGTPNPVPEADPNITAMSFGDPLIVGELVNFYLLTTVNLRSPYQNMFLVSTGEMDFIVTDGRLFDRAAGLGQFNPNTLEYAGVLNASLFFDLGGDVFTTFEFTDDGAFDLIPPVPEPATVLLVLGSLAGLAVPKRRK